MTSSGTIKHLWALDAPMLKVDKSIMILGAGGELVCLPAPSFLIEHPEHGLLLFDTGLAGAGDPASTYGPLAEIFTIEFPAERALDRQLESLGFGTADVKRVVISHLHFDHTGGLEHFAGAQGYIGSGELRYARTPDNHVTAFFRQEDLDAADRIDWMEVPAGYDHDMFGDGSVVVLSMPGHTPVHSGCSSACRTGARWSCPATSRTSRTTSAVASACRPTPTPPTRSNH